MFAHGGASEIDTVALARHSDQGEIAGASADVADQYRLAVEQVLL